MRHLSARIVSPCLLLLLQMSALTAAEPSYEKDVRPILKAHCFHCHGEAGEKEGGLDLRLRRLLVAGGDSGPAVVPSNTDESLLLERVISGDMPPGEDKRLSPEDVDVLTRWIAAGAPTLEPEPEDVGEGPIFTREERNYWAFQPVQRPDVPHVSDARRARTAIDAFLLAKSAEHPGFAPEADRAMLLRRASFDLTGLPPTPDELATILSDTSDEWWELAIDRLLSSPHYGERWGRHWLDVAGYADSEGYTDEDRVRPHAWRYRDYVIRAFNNDKPFDQFIQEQLAGDEMVPPPSPNLTEEQIEKLTATGFLRMAPDGTASGGINQTEARNQVVADTLQIVGTSLLGLTVNCAQCHDHRYDPIPQSDYFRLRAIFEPAFDWKKWKTPPQRQLSLYTDADRKVARELEQQAVEVEKQRLAKVEEYITRTLEEELELVPEELRESLRTAYRTAAKERTEQQQALLKEYPSVASISPGSLYLYDRRRVERAGKLDAERKKKEVRFVDETRQAALAQVPDDLRSEVEQSLKIAAEKRSPEQQELLKQFPAVLVTLANLKEFNAEAAEELSRDRELANELRASQSAPDLKKFVDEAAAIRARKPEEGFLRAIHEVPGTIPTTQVFYRGDPEQPREEVLPGELTILANRPEIPANDESLPTSGRRLAFAKALTNGTHPLLARVLVNRFWMLHFGKGLVNSPGDFGVLGERPTHPQLLDWLASEFVDSGWSLKALHRQIMTSAAYRQSSVTTEDVRRVDPDNQLYSRFPLQRLESEVLRDAMLVVTGKFNPKPFGPPIPVMEDSVGQIVLGKENLDGERKPVDKVDLGGEEFRRSVYIQERRTRIYSMFETFDAPTVSPNCERRETSTVAPQSLFFMNSDLVLEFAMHFADRLQAEAPGSLESQIRLAWQLAYGDSPGEDEVQQARSLIEREQTLIHEHDSKLNETEVTRSALSVFCQALLSSNRFLYVE
ncbi:MAG: DUF1553 domain-containing protein [Planctomycetaceae bacterium]|nr:DUF1553 domain-containing protein [Planctomycetaceae bacterium]